MMRRLVKRHKGILPLDTAESIWRVIISTFTYVQAPFSVHADLSAGDALMRDSARFHFGFTVPLRAAYGRRRRGRRGVRLQGRSRPGARHRRCRRRRLVERARIRRGAQDHRPAALRRARRPPGGAAGVRHLARRRRRHGDRSRASGACASPAGAPSRRRRCRRWRISRRARPRLRRRRPAADAAAGCHAGQGHRRAGQGRRHACARRPSSAATQPAIRLPPRRLKQPNFGFHAR